MPRTAIAGSLALALVACGTAGQQTHEASNTKERIDPPDPRFDAPKPEHLPVVAMTITSGADAIFIKADGSIETKGQDGRLAALQTTGELLHPNGGLLLTLNTDGTITGAHIQGDAFVGLVIGSDGALYQNGKQVSEISEEGAVVYEGAEIARISGPTEGRRAAMFVLVMMTATENPIGNGSGNGNDNENGAGDDDDSDGGDSAPDPATAP